jgi:hypothetical protein
VDRDDHNGNSLNDVSPSAISEHNGTNCSPGNPCRVRKVALFQVDRDLHGLVFANLAASCEVPGPGSAHVTVHDRGYVKSIKYGR